MDGEAGLVLAVRWTNNDSKRMSRVWCILQIDELTNILQSLPLTDIVERASSGLIPSLSPKQSSLER